MKKAKTVKRKKKVRELRAPSCSPRPVRRRVGGADERKRGRERRKKRARRETREREQGRTETREGEWERERGRKKEKERDSADAGERGIETARVRTEERAG